MKATLSAAESGLLSCLLPPVNSRDAPIGNANSVPRYLKPRSGRLACFRRRLPQAPGQLLLDSGDSHLPAQFELIDHEERQRGNWLAEQHAALSFRPRLSAGALLSRQ